jgi:hypothetical protein
VQAAQVVQTEPVARAAVARVAAPPRAAVLVATMLGTLLLWSVSYLLRQAAPAVDSAAAMRFAVEGMALALAWLASLVGGSVAVLCGAVVIGVPGAD